MIPRIVVTNYSASFLCRIQRRMKREPFDLYLFHQNEGSVAAISATEPAVIVIGRHFGYPQNDDLFVGWLRSKPVLKTVPIILSLLEGMPVPAARPASPSL